MSRMSFAESLFPTWPLVQSRHSIRTSVPGSVEATAGMSGCQRLCPGTSWSAIDLPSSTLKSGSGTIPPHLKRGFPTESVRYVLVPRPYFSFFSTMPPPYVIVVSITERKTSRQMNDALESQRSGAVGTMPRRRGDGVPIYEFLCEDCGSFEQQRPLTEAGEAMPCPSGGVGTRRVFHMPAPGKNPP